MNVRTFTVGMSLVSGIVIGQAASSINLPESLALPAGSSTTRGFEVRVAQAPGETAVANNAIRAYKQINGTLTDASGVLVPNFANPGSGPGGSYAVDTINFEKDGADVNITDLDGNALAFFPSQLFPGIPGTDGTTDKFAVEVVGFLDLPAGSTVFGISTTAERTDVNDDDSYQVFFGKNPRDFFGIKAADYERIAPGFQNGWRNENQFTVVAPKAGLYPIRILYWQTGSGASLDFYTISGDLGRVFVNDAGVAGAVKSYSDTSVADAKGPYVAEAAPSAGSEGNSAAARIEAVIVDGATTVATADVKLFLNDVAVTPQTLTKKDGQIYVGFDPNKNRTNPNNAVRLEYTDSAAVKRTATWSFGIVTTGGSSTQVTGQWDFESGNLAATVGSALEYLDGPNGVTQQGTKFGTTTELGVSDIAGKPARVMQVPGELDRRIGYIMTHHIAPNGGGTKVNQYTLIMDVLVDTSGPGAASLFQISSLSNTDDGDLFWQGNNFGQGNQGYNGRGTFTAGTWHRVVAAYDEGAAVPVVTKYVDGIKQDDWTTGQSLDNPRRALQPTAILFGDGDQDERRVMWVNSIQIRNGKISDAEAFNLGGPTAEGIPQVIPNANVTGQWDFNYGDLGASIGSNLQYLDGANGVTQSGTVFGVTGEGDLADVPSIGGVPAQVMKVPGDLDRNIGYIMDHRIAPNGGGTKVNQYTLIMDVYVETTGPGAASLLQISSLNNTDDGDLFWQGNNFGQGNQGYNGRGTFTAGAWHRVVAAYDMAAPTPVVAKFVDGVKQDDWTTGQGLDNPRRALQPTAILFGDGDQDERRVMHVNAIQIRSGRLSDVQCALLGGPSAAGIPVVLPTSNVTGAWDFDYADLGASVGSKLQYLDGDNGVTKAGTSFGVTGEGDFADVPLINGEAAKVMRVPGDLDRNIGYIMEHRIGPNGGGTKVNQYTLIMDLLVDTSGPGAASLLQISSLNNTDDGDLFWQGSNFGQGNQGYNGTGAFTAGSWHRIVASYNMAATPPVVVKYVDGIFQDNWTTGQSLDNPRRALQPTAILFGDGDQDERRVMWVNAIQIRSAPLSTAELEALGGPSASGIPLVIAAVTPPSIGVTTDGSGNVVLTFTGKLQAAGTLNGTFTDVAGATSPYVIAPGSQAAQQLYRAAN